MKSITVLKLKIDAERDNELLRRISEACRRARNAGMENWLLRQRGLPETEKQCVRLCANHKRANGESEKSESTKMYHAITAAVPDLGTTNASMIAAALNSHLSAKIDWRRGADDNGKRAKRRDAILRYEDRVPYFTAYEIPVRSKDSTLTWQDGKWSLTVRRPLRSVVNITIELCTRGLSAGLESILCDVRDGKKKFADSRIVLDNKGRWMWHLPVAFETDVRGDLTGDLWPTIGSEQQNGRHTERPLRLEFGCGRSWGIGDGGWLLAQTVRLIGLRKQIGWRYRHRMGAGHGRKKIDAAVRRRTDQLFNVRTEFRRRAIADIVRQCVRRQVGHLVYHEPTGPAKSQCWFAKSGTDWDWRRFVNDLKNACARQGIEVTVKKLAIGEILKWLKESEENSGATAAG